MAFIRARCYSDLAGRDGGPTHPQRTISPASLPARYQRGYSEELSRSCGLLSSSRSVSAAREALHKMGLSNSEQELEKIAAGFIEELSCATLALWTLTC